MLRFFGLPQLLRYSAAHRLVLVILILLPLWLLILWAVALS